MIPPHDADGFLPAGVHSAEWLEFAARFGDGPRRQRLLQGMARALRALRAAGCQSVCVGGSFVTLKAAPGDFDICWDERGVDGNLLATNSPELLIFEKGRALQKLTYGGELLPQSAFEVDSGLSFLEFFQQRKDTAGSIGVVALDLRSLP